MAYLIPSLRAMDGYTLIIIATTVGFILIAFLLLAPVYMFLDREEKLSQQWTEEAIARRARAAQQDSVAEP